MPSYSTYLGLQRFLLSCTTFTRYKRSEDARMALEQMDGFELAGRTVISADCCRFLS